MAAIARFCDCKVWFSRDELGINYVFFGFEADTSIAAHLLTVIDRAIRTEVATFRTDCLRLRGTALRRASLSFQLGMATRIAQRLTSMHKRREETRIRFVSVNSLDRRPADVAFRLGAEAGNRVRLDRPVNGPDLDLLT